MILDLFQLNKFYSNAGKKTGENKRGGVSEGTPERNPPFWSEVFFPAPFSQLVVVLLSWRALSVLFQCACSVGGSFCLGFCFGSLLDVFGWFGSLVFVWVLMFGSLGSVFCLVFVGCGLFVDLFIGCLVWFVCWMWFVCGCWCVVFLGVWISCAFVSVSFAS